jgi:hypothetical protein
MTIRYSTNGDITLLEESHFRMQKDLQEESCAKMTNFMGIRGVSSPLINFWMLYIILRLFSTSGTGTCVCWLTVCCWCKKTIHGTAMHLLIHHTIIYHVSSITPAKPFQVSSLNRISHLWPKLNTFIYSKRIKTKNMVLRHCLVSKCQRFELCRRAPIKCLN